MKVNMYYLVSSFGTDKECWRVLSDGHVCIIVRPEDTFLMDEEKGLYSVRSLKDAETHTALVKDVRAIIISEFGISLYKRNSEDDNDKKDATKI